MINPFDVRRGSGKTWLDDLNKAFMPCYPTTDGKAFDFPTLQWYHNGVAWCLKNKLMTNHKDGTFGVSETASRATRAETAVMITRFHVAMERSQKESLCRFPDEAGGWRTIMFTTSHFLWMGITVLVILITSFLLARFRCPTRPLLTGCLVLCVISELIKTFSNTVETGLFTNVSGPVKFLPVSCLPLQLCSLQIFFLFYQYFSKNEQRKADLNGFMCMCMAVGAPFAILLPNSSVSFSSPVAYQFFLFHAMLIVYAIHQIRTGSVTYSLRNLKIDLVLLLVLGIVSIWINSIFTAMGAPTDFLYTMCPPADNLPYLNLNQGWEMYVVKLTVLAMVLMLLYHMPFLLKNRGRDDVRTASVRR